MSEPTRKRPRQRGVQRDLTIEDRSQSTRDPAKTECVGKPALSAEAKGPPKQCTHDEVFDNLCCLCGKEIAYKSGYRVTDAKITDIAKRTGHFVKQENKKRVIFDIDNTLLVARVSSTNLTAIVGMECWRSVGMDVLWRPGMVEGATALSRAGVELYLQTKGTRSYAEQVKARLNAAAGDRIIRDENIMSRDEETGTNKSLAHFCNEKDPRAIVVDDRTDVWENDILNVIQIAAWEWPDRDETDEERQQRLEEDAVEVQRVFETIDLLFSETDAYPAESFANILRRILHGRAAEKEPDKDEIDVVTEELSRGNKRIKTDH